jgi:hypothetical protein
MGSVKGSGPRSKRQCLEIAKQYFYRNGIQSGTSLADDDHNETLVRDPAKAKPAAAQARGKEQQTKLQIVKLEERITPGTYLNHNETLIHDHSANTQ